MLGWRVCPLWVYMGVHGYTHYGTDTMTLTRVRVATLHTLFYTVYQDESISRSKYIKMITAEYNNHAPTGFPNPPNQHEQRNVAEREGEIGETTCFK